MTESFDFARFKRSVRGVIIAKQGQLTNFDLKNDYRERAGVSFPFDQFGPEFQKAMEDSDCVCMRGKWRTKGEVNESTANLQVNLSKMVQPKSARRNTRGGRLGMETSGARFPVRLTSHSTIPFNPQPRHSINPPINFQTNFKYRNGFTNEESGWPEDSCSNDTESRRNESENRHDSPYSNYRSYQGDHPNNQQGNTTNVRSSYGYSTTNDVSENDSDDNNFAPPGLVPGSGFRYHSDNHSTPSQTRSAIATPSQQSSGASFYFPPPPSGKSTSSAVEEKHMDDTVHYDELSLLAIDIFISAWPNAMNADELMNNLAKKTNSPALVGPKSMEHHSKLIEMIHKTERCIFIETIDKEKVYSYIPGSPMAVSESDLYEQVGKMLSLVLHTYGDMTIESAQSRLGLPDGSEFTKLKGCALIMVVSGQNDNIIVGQSASGQGKDKNLSLRYGASVRDLRSEVHISRRCTAFPKSSDVSGTHRDTVLLQEDRVKSLLSECENYPSGDFAVYQSHPLIEQGPEDKVDWYKSTMIYYSSLDKFAVIINNDREYYASVQNYLQEDYEGIEWNEIFLKYVKEGAAVGVKKESGKFSRGIVTHYERNPTESSFVYLVDDGYIDEVPINRMFPLKDSMKELHPLAIRCSVGSYRTIPEKLEKYYDEHREIWKTLNLPGHIEILPQEMIACGGKKELVVHLKFTPEQEEYYYPKDLIENNIITML